MYFLALWKWQNDYLKSTVKKSLNLGNEKRYSIAKKLRILNPWKAIFCGYILAKIGDGRYFLEMKWLKALGTIWSISVLSVATVPYTILSTGSSSLHMTYF